MNYRGREDTTKPQAARHSQAAGRTITTQGGGTQASNKNGQSPSTRTAFIVSLIPLIRPSRNPAITVVLPIARFVLVVVFLSLNGTRSFPRALPLYLRPLATLWSVENSLFPSRHFSTRAGIVLNGSFNGNMKDADRQAQTDRQTDQIGRRCARVILRQSEAQHLGSRLHSNYSCGHGTYMAL